MILILTQCFPSRLGGIESLLSNLALGLAKSEKVIVFADSHHLINDADFDNVIKNRMLIKRTKGIKFFRRRKKIREVRNFIESNKVKVIIADTWKSIELGIDYFNKKNIPVICLAHGNELLFNNKKRKNRIDKIFNKTTSVVANSIFTKNLVKKIISSEVDLSFIYPGAEDLNNIKNNEIYNILEGPVILTLARLEKRKGHREIINSIQRLVPEFLNIQYIIAGSGPELHNLKKIVKEKNLEKNILFVGKVNNGQKKFLFEKAQLMIMPTRDETQNRSIEGFGIAYIEAAFFSIPSIASDIGGTPEAIIHNSTGKIIQNIDDLFLTIRELLLDPKQINHLGQNAKKRANEEFRWDYISKKYLSLINKVTKIR
tara:strand:+ start:1626 stop:2741 length:1116 start_codon:yes stop_codon:yes gene_type:complete